MLRAFVSPADCTAIAWSIACCWLAVLGSYGLLELGLSILWIVPLNLFVLPVLVTALFWMATSGRKRRL